MKAEAAGGRGGTAPRLLIGKKAVVACGRLIVTRTLYVGRTFAQSWYGLNFRGHCVRNWLQYHILLWLSHNYSVPTKAVPASNLNLAALDKKFTKDSSLLEHLNMDIELPLPVQSVGGEQGVPRADASQLVLSLRYWH